MPDRPEPASRLSVQLKHIWLAAEWPTLAACAAAALVLGMIGYSRHFGWAGESRTPFDLVYYSLQLFVLESAPVAAPIPWQLELARWLAPGVSAYTAAQAFALILRDELQWLRIRRLREHVVICGLGVKGLLLATAFRRRGNRVVVIEQDAANLSLQRCRDHGCYVVVANAVDPALLRGVGIHRARYVVAVCGDDGVNAEVALQACEASGVRRVPLTAFLHIVEPRLCDLLRERQIAAGNRNCRLEFFNVFERGATALINDLSEQTLQHLVLVGLGRMGESVLIQAARQRWAQGPSVVNPFRATIVDRVATARIQSVRQRYPSLPQVCDLVARDIDVESPEFERAGFLPASTEGPAADVVCICLDDDARGLAAALALSRHLEQHKVVPVIVRIRQYAGLAKIIESRAHQGGGLRVFGLLDRTCAPEALLAGINETLAVAIHEDYVGEQRRSGATPATNPSMVAWDDLPETLRESNRRQADHLSTKLREVGCAAVPLVDWKGEAFRFSSFEIEQLARLEHERWRKERLAEGWKHRLGDKDPVRKTHPYLVDWQVLPDEVKELNRKTVQGLSLVLDRVGFRIARLGGGQEQRPAVEIVKEAERTSQLKAEG